MSDTGSQFPGTSSCNTGNMGSDGVKKPVVFFKWGSQNAPFHCQVCNMPFENGDSLKKHVAMEHNDLTTIMSNTCVVCNSSFPTTWSLQQHQATHEKMERCKYCGVRFSNKTRLNQHMKGHTDLLKCTQCPQKFLYQHRLDVHMVTHQPKKNFACEICPKKFNRHDYLKKHLLTHKKDTSDKKKFSCTECSKAFPTLLLLKEHANKMHGQKDVGRKCEICGKIVRCSGLARHRKTHSDQRDFHCTLCDKKFIQKDHLITHMSTHSDERNFTCSVCNASFKHKRSLQKHSNVHWLGNFGFEANSTVSSTSSNHSSGNFQCMVCKDLDFEEEKLLLKHIRDCHVIKHSAEKKRVKAETPNFRYQCLLCNKLLIEKSLIKHNRSHKNVNGNKRAYIVLKKDPESTAQNAELGEVDVENNSTTPDNITDVSIELNELGNFDMEHNSTTPDNITEISTELTESGNVDMEHNSTTLDDVTEVSTEITESGVCDKVTNNGTANAENESFCEETSSESPKKLSNGLKAESRNLVIRNVVEVDEDVSDIIVTSDNHL